jgi:hypothetical protein
MPDEDTAVEPEETGEEESVPEDEGRAALEALKARLLALPADLLETPNVDIQRAAMTARGVAHTQLLKSEVRSLFAKLGKLDEYDDSCCVGAPCTSG